jgi:hypothetical protein
MNMPDPTHHGRLSRRKMSILMRFLIVDHRLAAAMGEEHPGSRAGLMSGVLVDDGIHASLHKKPPRKRREFVADENDLPCFAGFLQCLDDSPRARADAVDADQVDIVAEQGGCEIMTAHRIVMPLKRRKRRQGWILRTDHLLKPEEALRMVPQCQAPGDHADLALPV